MKIRCIVVEDEPKARELLVEHIQRTPFLELQGQYYDPVEASHFLTDREATDLVFLDIQLPGISGFDLAKVIHPQIKIIFTTAYADYGVRSYEVNTIDYLLKPVSYQRFFQAASKARLLFESEKVKPSETEELSHFFVKSGKRIVQVNWKDIQYVEALREYVAIVTDTEKVLAYKRISEFETLMPDHLVRVHNSYIVNLNKMEKVEDNEVYMPGRTLPISRSYRESFYNRIKNRLL